MLISRGDGDEEVTKKMQEQGRSGGRGEGPRGQEDASAGADWEEVGGGGGGGGAGVYHHLNGNVKE